MPVETKEDHLVTIPSHTLSPCIIRTERLTKTFHTLVAVNNLDLQVMRGDVFGFLGQNGSGKTTSIRMLLGLIRPTAGHIEMFGMDHIRQLSAILARLGAIIENPVFYPYLSGMDNLRILAARSGMQVGKASNRRIGEMLDLIDLRERAHDTYRTSSLGMKQRLGIGAALLADPELVLLDEPTNGVDPEGVHDIRELILRLAQLGKTVFLTSHLLYEVQQVCNRVAILHKGRLLRQGNVQELLHHERIVVHMQTAEETEQARTFFQQVQTHVPWITGVSIGTDDQLNAVVHVDAPTTCSPELTALLTQQQLFAAEVYHYQTSLEEFYLDVTASSAGEGAQSGMALSTR